MGIDDDAFIVAKRIAENDVRRLSPDARKLAQLRHRVRNFPAMLFHDRRRRRRWMLFVLLRKNPVGLNRALRTSLVGACA